jgi:hypothetical protein
MSEGTFNPDASMHYQMDAVMNMQASLMNEEMVNSLGLLKVSNALQDAGIQEVFMMWDIYATGFSHSDIGVGIPTIVRVTFSTQGGTYTYYTLEGTYYQFQAPGWGSTRANEETSAAASVQQEYFQMVTTSEKSISQAFQQMISQDKQGDNSLSSFAQNGFLAQKSYNANLMASNLG